MNDVIERLKKSKAEWVQRQEQTKAAGREAGATWAKETAEFIDLVHLSNYAAGRAVEADPDDVFAAIFPDEDNDVESGVFWSRWPAAYRGGRVDPWFVSAFVAGSIQVWNEVQGQL